MSTQGKPLPTAVLKPLKGIEMFTTVSLFHLGDYVISIPGYYMSDATCYMLMVVSYVYVVFISLSIMAQREGDYIHITPMFACYLVGIPLFIIVGLICYFTPSSDSTFLAVKATLLLCFVLAGTFLGEILMILREHRKYRLSRES